ncbi:MAG: hypothetical protein AAGN66_26200, partial [Acidobacteriota bacterium]
MSSYRCALRPPIVILAGAILLTLAAVAAPALAGPPVPTLAFEETISLGQFEATEIVTVRAAIPNPVNTFENLTFSAVLPPSTAIAGPVTNNANGVVVQDGSNGRVEVRFPGPVEPVEVRISYPIRSTDCWPWAQVEVRHATTWRDTPDYDETAVATLPVAEPQVALLGVRKADATGVAVPGATVRYELAVVNDTPARAVDGVIYRETVPAFTRFEAAGSDDWSLPDGAPAGSIGVLDVGTLHCGEEAEPVFVARVDDVLPVGAREVVNVATAEPPAGPTATATARTPIDAAVDLRVNKVADRPTVNPGERIAWSSLISNSGTIGASGVQLVETVPDHTRFDPAGSFPNWVCDNGGGPGDECLLRVRDIAGGGTVSISRDFAVIVDDPLLVGVERIENTVRIEDDGQSGPDANPADNQSTAVVDIDLTSIPYDLQVEKTSPVAAVAPGDVLPFVLSYRNAAAGTATGVRLVEHVPDGTTFDAGASTTGWSCDAVAAGSRCELSLGVVSSLVSGQATFAVRVNLPWPGGAAVENGVTILGDGTDADPSNDDARLSVPVTGSGVGVDLSIDLSDRGATARPGEVFELNMAWRNLGNVDARDIRLNFPVPQWTTFEEGTLPGWTCQPSTAA